MLAAGVLRNMSKPVPSEVIQKIQLAAMERLFVEEESISVAAATLAAACGRWCELGQLLEAVDESTASGPEEWNGQLAELRVHLVSIAAPLYA